jgi:hypothetical protein
MRNATVVFPSFAFGTKDPVTVVAHQIDRRDWFGLSFIATDVDGNQTICDPVIASLLREGGTPTAQTWTNLPAIESKVTIANSATNGANSAEIVVNGTTFRMTGLANGEERTIDVASAMLPGDVNTISATVMGGPGSAATLTIAN